MTRRAAPATDVARDDPSPQPSFSVVIPTVGRIETLSRAVRSAVDQEHAALEVIVVDDGPTPGVEEVSGLGSPTCPVRVISQPRRGVSGARNAGAAAATGEYLVFLDDDDDVERQWLAQFAHAIRRSWPAVVSGPMRELDEDGTLLGIRRPRPKGRLYGDRTFVALASAFAVRRDLFLDVGGYEESLPQHENLELFLRLTDAAQRRGMEFVTVDEVACTRHRRAAPVRFESMHQAACYFLTVHGRRLAQSGQTDRYLTAAGIYAVLSGLWGTGLRHLWSAMTRRPRDSKAWARLLLALVPFAAKRYWGPRLSSTILGPPGG